MLLFGLCYAVVVMLLVGAYMLKLLSPRGLGIAGLIAMVTAAIVLTRFIQKAREKYPTDLSSPETDPIARKKLRRTVLWMKAGVAYFTLALINLLLGHRNDPLWLRLGGSAFGLGWIALFVWVIKKTQRRLKGEG
jgi:hypothetical protein